jgi:hypothetical protein
LTFTSDAQAADNFIETRRRRPAFVNGPSLFAALAESGPDAQTLNRVTHGPLAKHHANNPAIAYSSS